MITRRGFLAMSGLALSMLVIPQADGAGPRRVPVLLYHSIAFEEGEYTTDPPFFAVQMEVLHGEGFTPLFMRDLGASLPERPVIITFDDGYTSFADYAFPLLEVYGFKATMNLIGKYVDSFSRIDGNRLSWDECRSMQASGRVEFGCHTFDRHDRNLLSGAGLSPDIAEKDLLRFQEVFAKEMGRPAEVLAWPYGIYTAAMQERAMRLGFKYILTSRKGYFLAGAPAFEVPRINIGNGIDLKSFKNYLGVTA